MNYETYAFVICAAGFPIKSFLSALGVASQDAALSGDKLYVAGKLQAELDSALAAFDAATARVNEQWVVVRAQRDLLLAATDFTQLGDYSKSNKAAMVTYRQSLRDIPQTQSDPFNIVWPVSP